MEEIHNINYEGLELEVHGNYEEPEPEIGYKGGWLTVLVKVNDVDIYWMLKPFVIDRITYIINDIR